MDTPHTRQMEEHPSRSGALPQASGTSWGQEGVGASILRLCLQFPAQLHQSGDAQKTQVSKARGAVGQKATSRSFVPRADQDPTSRQLSPINVLGLSWQ